MNSSAQYDESGNFALSSTDNLGNTSETVYDTLSDGTISGVPLAVINSYGEITTKNVYSYDSLDRLTEVTLQEKLADGSYSDISSVEYTYNSLNQLTAITRGTMVYNFRYDEWGKTTEVSIGSGENKKTLVNNYYLDYNGAINYSVYGNGAACLYQRYHRRRGDKGF